MRNSLQLIHLDGVVVEGVQNIRAAVLNHFSTHYRATNMSRPGVNDLNFRRLTYA